MNSIWLRVYEASGNWNVSHPLWLSGRASIAEVQVPSISQGLVNTAQPLAACHSLYVVDSFGKFDTLMSFLENLAGFSGPSMADPFLLNSGCQTQMWGYPGPVVRMESMHFINFQKTKQNKKPYHPGLWEISTLAAEMGHCSLCLLCCHQFPSKWEPISWSIYCINRPYTVRQDLDSYLFSWHT